MASKGILFRYSLQTFAIVLVIAIFIRIFLFQSYVMSGAAMLPSVWPGDFVLASKMRVKDLRRGEVVALRCPLDKEKLCMKRVVGLPGDRVEYRGDRLMINGQLAQYRVTGDFQVEMVAGFSWGIWPTGVRATEVEKGPIVVPPANIYLLNDKRADRDDSRSWGPVTEDFVEAKVMAVWMSLDWYDGEKVRTWPRIRWVRLFRVLD